MLRRLEVGLLCVVVICVLCVVPWRSACGDKKHISGTRIRLFSAESEQSPATPDRPHPFAYVLYATSETYLCSAVINAVRLKDLNVTVAADIVIIIDQAWLERSSTAVARRLRVLRALDVSTPQSFEVLADTCFRILPVPCQDDVLGPPAWQQSLALIRGSCSAGEACGCQNPAAVGGSCVGAVFDKVTSLRPDPVQAAHLLGCGWPGPQEHGPPLQPARRTHGHAQGVLAESAPHVQRTGSRAALCGEA